MEAVKVHKKSKIWVILIPIIVIISLVVIALVALTILENNGGGKVLTQNLSQPLGDATAAKYDLNTGTGNLTIDSLPRGQQLLASGTVQYLEDHGFPSGILDMNKGLYTFSLKANGGPQAGFRLPWAACNGEMDWQFHLNPTLPSDITAYSDGGNININLTGMVFTNLVAETGGGNVDVVLPQDAASFNASAKSGAGNVTVEVGGGTTGSSTLTATSGAGNVTVRLPEGMAARIHASTGLGKLVLDPQFAKIDDATYQTPNYDRATDKIDITVETGAGDVSIITK